MRERKNSTIEQIHPREGALKYVSTYPRPLDGSLRVEQAVPISARLARASGGSITLLRVVTHPRDAVVYLLQPPAKADTALEGQHAQAADYLTRLASSDELAGVGTALEVADSDPAQTILSAARLQQVDSIVMCSHGTTGFKRWALGSVAQKVARHSPVPVLLLRADATRLSDSFRARVQTSRCLAFVCCV